MLALNALLSFENWWPTPLIKPDTRLAPEFVLLWVVLLVGVRAGRAIPRRGLTALALGYGVLVIGRYVDVTVPALFGRGLNLYWDAPQLPRFVVVSAQNLALWESAAIVAVVVAALYGLLRLVRALIERVARDAAPWALGSRGARAATVAAVVLVSANIAGVKATWPFVSKPVLPTYASQAVLLATALSPSALAHALPASPAFDADLARLAGRDVHVFFLESYGAFAFRHTATRERLAADRQVLADTIRLGGRRVVSAFVRSPTIGGASDLAHLSLLSGIDLSNPRRHDLLLTTDRPNLVRLFAARGYETFGLYPALSWDWPERRHYGYQRFLDGPALGYRGPRIGYWWIPDQYTVARFGQLHPIGESTPPRFLFFASITSHIPFRPVPPYQPDWERVLGEQPFAPDELARSLAEPVDWLDLYPAYVRMMAYNYRWLSGHLARPAARDFVLVLLGDHQPAAGVTGDSTDWDVPVHVIASDEAMLARLEAAGFVDGIEPRGEPLGPMHRLTTTLLEVFSSERAGGR